jgi:hypothetical protein
METTQQYKKIANTGDPDKDFVKVGEGGDYVETNLRRTYLRYIAGSVTANTEYFVGWTPGSVNELGITINADTQTIKFSEDGDYLVETITMASTTASNVTMFIRKDNEATWGYGKQSVNSQTTGKSICTCVVPMKAGESFKVALRADANITIDSRPNDDTLRIYKLADKTPRYIVDDYVPMMADGGIDTSRSKAITFPYTVTENGYVKAAGSSSSGAGGVVILNGEIVFNVQAMPYNGNTRDMETFRVSVGDIVTVSGDSQTGTFYYPKPAAILVRKDYNDAQLGTDYSTVEHPVMIIDQDTGERRQKKFIDGSPIWEKTIPWKHTETLMPAGKVEIGAHPEIKGIINTKVSNIISSSAHNMFMRPTTQLVIRNDSSEAYSNITDVTYYTIQYIKNI